MANSSLLALAPDPEQRRCLSAIDPGAGLILHVCGSSAEANRLVHRLNPDVVVAGRNAGATWLMQCRTRDADAFRILWAGRTQLSAALDAVNHGDADAVLRDPFEATEALALFHHGCEQALLRRHTRSLVDELAVRNAELLGFNERLEELVAERTNHLLEAQARLQESQRQMVQLETQATVTHLLRGLAHEFNNPLAAIYGYAQRLHRQATESELQRRLGVILQEVEHCRRVVQQLTQLATPLSEQSVHVDPCAALREGAARMAAGGRDVPRLDLPAAAPLVVAAPRALARACEQILLNAADAGAAHVELCCDEAAGRVRMLVSNDGETPDETVVANAVRPFFTTRAAEDRRGLGLSTAAALLREQDGTIELVARHDGQGATAIIGLPAAYRQVAGSSSSLLPAIRLGNHPEPTSAPVTLVIDDEPLVAEILVDALREAGCTTATAGSVAEAMEELAHLDVCALIVDLHLPDGSGLDVARRALALKPALAGHIALATGESDPGTLAAMMADYGFPILGKPFRIEEVQQLAQRIR